MTIACTHGIQIAENDHVLIRFEKWRNRGVDPVERLLAGFDRKDRRSRLEVKTDHVEIRTRPAFGLHVRVMAGPKSAFARVVRGRGFTVQGPEALKGRERHPARVPYYPHVMPVRLSAFLNGPLPCMTRVSFERRQNPVPCGPGLGGCQAFLNDQDIRLHPREGACQPCQIGRRRRLLGPVRPAAVRKPADIPRSDPKCIGNRDGHATAILDNTLAVR